MKVLFLDIDGVLNSGKWYRESRSNRLESSADRDGRSKEELRFRHKLGHLDPAAVIYLNHIVENTGCKIVISSTWRTYETIENIQRMLMIKGFRYVESIIGVTDDLNCDGSRGYEIHDWLNHAAESFIITSFCILDDDSDMWHLLPWHVRTNNEDGLSHYTADVAIKLLNNPREELTGWEHVYKYFNCKDYGVFDKP